MLEDFKNSSEVIMKKVLVGFGLFAISLSSFASGKYGKFSYCLECVDEYALYKGQETVSAYESYQVGQYIYIAEEDASFQIQFIFSTGEALLRKWVVEDGEVKVKKLKIKL